MAGFRSIRKRNKEKPESRPESMDAEKGLRLMRDNRLRRLLDARHSIVPEELEHLGIRFTGKWFILVLVKSHLSRDSGDDPYDAKYGEICELLDEALCSGTMSAWVFPHEWDIYGIVNFDSDAPELQRIKLIDLLEALMPVLCSRENTTIKAYVSRCADSMAAISELHESLAFLYEYDTVLKSPNLALTYERLAAMNSNPRGASNGLREIEDTQQFFSQILKEQYREARQTILELIDGMLCDINITIMPLSLTKARLGFLIVLMDMAVDVIRLRIPPTVFSDMFPRLDFRECDNVQEFREITNAIFDELLILRGEKLEANYAFSWVSDVKHYIDAHYADVRLNVNFLADEFDMNPSYMSRVFRSKVNISIPDYIAEVRVRKVKHLLKSGHTVAEAAAATGFGSVRTMSRVFQHKESVTPGKYRAALPANGEKSENNRQK